jgi:hypothetical protein
MNDAPSRCVARSIDPPPRFSRASYQRLAVVRISKCRSLRQNVPSGPPEVTASHVRRIGLQVDRDLPQDLLARQPTKCREHRRIEESRHTRTVSRRLTGGGRNVGPLTFSLPGALRHAETACHGPYRARKR